MIDLWRMWELKLEPKELDRETKGSFQTEIQKWTIHEPTYELFVVMMAGQERCREILGEITCLYKEVKIYEQAQVLM